MRKLYFSPLLLLLPFAVSGNGPGQFIPPPACPGMTLNISGTDVLCFGDSTGTAQVAVVSSNEPLTYLWSSSASDTTAAVTGLVAGTYTVYVTDSTGCTDSAQINISQPAALNLSSVVTNTSCSNSLDGSIDLTVTGGVSPYSYNWINGPGTQDQNNIGPGSYKVIVTDANGCVDSLTSVVSSAAPWNVSSTITDALCNGGNGSVNVTVSGATPPYTYSWSNGVTTQNLSGVPAGTYNLNITDNVGCTFTLSATVSEPAAINVTSLVTNVSCTGGSTGAIDITAVGGTAPYTYSWSTGATSEDLTGLTAGTYTVTVTDANSCTGNASIIVSAAGPLTLNVNVTNVSCNGAGNGSVNLTANGGTAPYTYLWNTGATTEDISNLTPGTYSVTVTDAAGCSNTTNATVSQPSALTINSGVTNILCNGQSNGAINITISGGTGPYTYLWSNGDVTEDISGLAAGNYSVTVTDANNCTAVSGSTVTEPAVLTLNSINSNVSCNGGSDGSINLLVSGGMGPFQFNWSNGAVTEDLSGISAGNYSVTVTDANGCFDTLSAIITQPSALGLSVNTTNATCAGVNNGSIDLVITGGTGPYTYSWNTGAATEDLSSLGAGNYTVTVTDDNGCSANISTTILAPSTITLSTSSTPSVCGGSTGTASVSVSGGTAPYAYLWSPGGQTTSSLSNIGSGNYNVIVTDNNGCVASSSVSVGTSTGFTVSSSVTNVLCNGGSTGSVDITPVGGSGTYTYSWSNGATTEDIVNVSAGSYSVSVSDGSCTYFLSAVVTQPQVLALGSTVTGPGCNGGNSASIDLSVSGGSVPYAYSWSTGATVEDISGLTAGSYSVTVTDNNGCTASASMNISNPPTLSAFLFTTDVTCNGASDGTADLTVFGGVAPYSYIWNTGAVTQDLSSLSPGVYSVTVTDASGCSATVSDTVAQPAPLTLSYIATHVACNGGGYGAIDLTVSGGTQNYSWLWSGGQTSEDLNGLNGGVYGIVVTDANGCIVSDSISISEPDSIVSSITSTAATCGSPDGTATVTVSGGVAPYTYIWNDPLSQNSATATNLLAGPYGVTITDANGCLHSESVVVANTGGPDLTAVSNNVSCTGLNDGSIDLTVNGGTAPFSYLWSTSSTSQDIANLAGGTYFVTVTDANNCQDTLSAFISEPDTLKLSGVATNVFCQGDSTGSIDITVTGGVGPYNYFWTPDMGNTEDLSNLPTGTYSLQIADSKLCIRSETFSIIAISPPVQVQLILTNASCTGKSDGSISAIASGGSAPYTYEWSNGVTGSSQLNVPPRSYTVQVTDANGCIGFGGGVVQVNSELCDSLSIPSAFSPNGDGTNDVWVIRNIHRYSSVVVQIFNRWGAEVFSSNGYPQAWDGTYSGEPVPAATYYYVIRLDSASEVITGTVTIVR